MLSLHCDDDDSSSSSPPSLSLLYFIRLNFLHIWVILTFRSAFSTRFSSFSISFLALHLRCRHDLMFVSRQFEIMLSSHRIASLCQDSVHVFSGWGTTRNMIIFEKHRQSGDRCRHHFYCCVSVPTVHRTRRHTGTHAQRFAQVNCE